MPSLATTASPSIAAASSPTLRRIYDRILPPALDTVFPLLLAIADDELAAAAIRVTLALAHTKGAVPTVMRALGEGREAEAVVSPFVGAVMEECLSPEYRNECRDSLQKQVDSVAGRVRWRYEIADQSPTDAVIEQARQLRAGLIVMGLRHHGVLQRALSRDMLREVVMATRVPVLAVRPELGGLPKRVVVAVDFGVASIRAARLARHLLADDGTMYLVHVATGASDSVSRRINPLSGHSNQNMRAELDSLIEDLSPLPGMMMTSIVIDSDVQLSIEGYAQRVDADLLAVGSDQHSFIDRLLSGSVSMGLAHTARWSTLVVPCLHDE